MTFFCVFLILLNTGYALALSLLSDDSFRISISYEINFKKFSTL